MADYAVMFGIGDVIKKLREDRGWTLDDLERESGVNRNTISQLENHNRDPKGSTINKIAGALGFPNAGGLYALVPQLERDLTRHGHPSQPLVEAERDGSENGRRFEPESIPVIAEGEATPSGMQWTNVVTRDVVIEYIARPDDVDDPEAYGLLVIGDSMQPVFKKGHRLVASPQTPIEDGDEVYVQLKDGRRLIKTAHRRESGWSLESVNPLYEPIVVTDDDVESMHPIVWSKRKRPGRRVIDEATGKRLRPRHES